MSEESEEDGEEAGPRVELGEGATVEGIPVARVASRLTWPRERSAIVERAGETEIRTPDGPRALSDVLEATDVTYFPTRQSFLEAVRDVVGTGPVPTE